MTFITPQEIQAKEFHVRFRGFDIEEVDTFLEKLAEDHLELLQENTRLKLQVEEMEKEVDDFRKHEKSFKKAMLTAQQIADEMRERSGREADEMIAGARDEIKILQDEAQASLTRLKEEIEELKAMKTRARDELKNMLSTYLSRLDECFTETGVSGTRTAKDPDVPEQAAPAPEATEPDVSYSEIDELSDLYEKIDPGAKGPEESKTAASDAGARERTVPGATPDLDGEITFPLEDPWDEEEPDVIFNDEDPEDGKKDQ